MKFVVDAQLPPQLAALLASLGHEAGPVAELPGGPQQTDSDVAAIADAEGGVVVTKDSDFRHSHSVSGSPSKLLLVAPATSATMSCTR